MRRNRRRVRLNRPSSPSLLENINPNAAGIDCGSAEHYVAVAPERDPNPIRCFKTFTADLHQLADWVCACGVATIAIEATGVYWIPVYEILEARGIQVVLVNARHVKNVPGRKSDVIDCEWLRQLHSVGLLRGSFRPAAAIATLRCYLRHRETLIETVTTTIQRMQKALVQMNLQLHLVISDIAGTTGLRILRDIVAGRTDPQQLAKHRDTRCRASETEIAGALTGNYKPEYVFVLKQNLDLFDVYQQQLQSCDVEIEAHLKALANSNTSTPRASLPAPRTKAKPRDNEPRFDVRPLLHRITGTDLTQLHAIGSYSGLKLISEIGTDMSRWPTEKHFTSWLTLAPKNKISGGRLLSSSTQPSANRAAVVLRVAAMSLGRTKTALGAFYRRLAFRIGKAKAITATARKLAILIYRALKGELQYQDPGADAYDARHRESVVRRLRKRAEGLGYTLVNRATGEILEGGVS
jgi:transposase